MIGNVGPGVDEIDVIAARSRGQIRGRDPSLPGGDGIKEARWHDVVWERFAHESVPNSRHSGAHVNLPCLGRATGERVEHLPAANLTPQRVCSRHRTEVGGEVASPFVRRGHAAENRGAPHKSESLIATEEPRFPLQFPQRNRATQGEAELILVEVRPIGRIEKVASLYGFVAVEFIGAAMQPICARLGDDVDDAANRLSYLSRIIV